MQSSQQLAKSASRQDHHAKGNPLVVESQSWPLTSRASPLTHAASLIVEINGGAPSRCRLDQPLGKSLEPRFLHCAHEFIHFGHLRSKALRPSTEPDLVDAQAVIENRPAVRG